MTNALTRLRAALGIGLLSISFGMLAACDRAASAASPKEVTSSAEIANHNAFSARVVGVTDGDTVKVLDENNDQHTIRLAEVDAPERGQPWGSRSKEALSELVFGKVILVQQTDTDRYGRMVGHILSDGRDVNRVMLEQGAAWAFRRYLTDVTLIEVEAKARHERAGLWSLSEAQTVAPWDWRRGVREGGTRSPEAVTQPVYLAVTPVNQNSSSGQFSCSGKRFCRQMTSCAEAHFYLRQCGFSSLDGNNDGEPCEVLCGTTTAHSDRN